MFFVAKGVFPPFELPAKSDTDFQARHEAICNRERDIEVVLVLIPVEVYARFELEKPVLDWRGIINSEWPACMTCGRNAPQGDGCKDVFCRLHAVSLIEPAML